LRIIPIDKEEKRKDSFSKEWQAEFGDKIQAEADGKQYVVIRTRVKENIAKGIFESFHYSLASWPDRKNWSIQKVKENKLSGKIQGLPFFGIEAKRDLHHELRDKSSFAGKILSTIEYESMDIVELEKKINSINIDAVEKSLELSSLKSHLEKLNKSFGGAGNTEITPFPKKIRDLSKNFTVHFGEDEKNTFSMEYHGMGTRSWASMLTVKAFIELTAKRHKKEVEPFFPLLAAEEPEAHLHPNAQKTLYKQLVDTQGQIILSTHSPYLAAMADPMHLRALKKELTGCKSFQLSVFNKEELRKLTREVIHSRGDILFSKAIILCEGETEEQALPMLFEKLFSNCAHELDVSFVGVGGNGSHYKPFLTMARDFSIPIFVFSDGETQIQANLKKVWKQVFPKDDDTNNNPHITILDDTDFEGYLLKNGFSDILEKAIEKVEKNGEGEEITTSFVQKWIDNNEGSFYGRPKKTEDPPCKTCNRPYIKQNTRDYLSKNGRDRAIQDILDKGKTKYAPAIANQLCLLDEDKLPQKFIEFFGKLKKELQNA
jgi:putative ATP-dependent endonuclease of OLD family